MQPRTESEQLFRAVRDVSTPRLVYGVGELCANMWIFSEFAEFLLCVGHQKHGERLNGAAPCMPAFRARASLPQTSFVINVAMADLARASSSTSAYALSRSSAAFTSSVAAAGEVTSASNANFAPRCRTDAVMGVGG